MAGNRYVPTIFTALDVNGAPIPGAKLYFYVNSSSTPQDTWADIDLIVTNPFPIVADAAGRFTDDIFLGSDPYRVVLTDESDVVIWDKDNCNTFNNPGSGSFPYRGAVIDFWGTQGELDVFTSNDWYVMDGTSGTPDLLDRYIKACVDVAGLGVTGGAASITPTGTADGHSITVDEMPVHNHNAGTADGSTDMSIYGSTTDDLPGLATYSVQQIVGSVVSQAITGDSGNGDAHTHNITINAFDNNPEFYTLIKLVYLP